eukprot:Hpha_TRINITY_DN15857_c5_g1::TRINITY_DN15857_c5_g1_i1::g.190650::m.190650
MLFDSLQPQNLFFSGGSLIFAVVVAAVQSYTPDTQDACVARASILLFVCFIYFGYIVFYRVFISALDNLVERVVAFADLLLAALSLASSVTGLGKDHWTVALSGGIEFSATLVYSAEGRDASLYTAMTLRRRAEPQCPSLRWARPSLRWACPSSTGIPIPPLAPLFIIP